MRKERSLTTLTSTTDLEYLQKLDTPEDEEYNRSLVDLIEAKTIDLELAAWLVAQIWDGASFITGSGPGGVGKTTTMQALLGFVPTGLPFTMALPDTVPPLGGPRSCILSDELSSGRPPTYLWGDDLRAFFALGAEAIAVAGAAVVRIVG